jgi:hypothetical protein
VFCENTVNVIKHPELNRFGKVLLEKSIAGPLINTLSVS